jgi:tetratricopeptide (TPR) repeat protein
MRVGQGLMNLAPLQQTNKARTAEMNQRMDSFVLGEKMLEKKDDRRAKVATADTIYETSITDIINVMNVSKPDGKSKVDLANPMSFEAFSQKIGIKELGLNDKARESLKKQYNQATKLETKGKFDEAAKVWDKLINDIDEKFEKFELKQFGQGMKSLGFNDKEVKALQKQYQELIQLERDGKLEEAEKLWKALDKKISDKEKAEQKIK